MDESLNHDSSTLKGEGGLLGSNSKRQTSKEQLSILEEYEVLTPRPQDPLCFTPALHRKADAKVVSSLVSPDHKQKACVTSRPNLHLFEAASE